MSRNNEFIEIESILWFKDMWANHVTSAHQGQFDLKILNQDKKLIAHKLFHVIKKNIYLLNT